MNALALTSLLPVFATYVEADHEESRAPLAAFVLENAIYWRAKDGKSGELSLHSVGLKNATVMQDHNYFLLWRIDLPIAWRIQGKDVWALACHILQPPYKEYHLYKIPLSTKQSNIINYWDHMIARGCDRLLELSMPQAEKEFYFDFLPVGHDRGRLFLLEVNRIITVWEYLPDDGEPKPHAGKWTKADEYDAPFFEPFQIYFQGDDPFALARSGVYSIRAARQDSGKAAFEKTLAGPIVAVIDDQRTGKVHAFTRSSSYSLDKLDIAKPFEFPDLGDNRDDTAKALVRAVEFLDSK